MAVQITDENFEQYLAQYTRALESEGEVKGVTIITNPDNIRNTLTLPGVNYDTNPISNPNAIASDYVQIPYSVLLTYKKKTDGVLDYRAYVISNLN